MKVVCLGAVAATLLLCGQVWCEEARMQVLGDVSLPNLLQNGDLEQAESGKFPHWSPWTDGYEVSAGRGRGGSTGAGCRAVEPGQFGLMQTLQLDQSSPAPVVVRGWSKAEAVSGRPDAHYSLYLDVYFREGEPLYGQHSPFDTGTHDWQQRTVLVFPRKPIQSINVYALFRSHAGRVWFDDFQAHQWEPATAFGDGGWTGRGVASFDGLPLAIAPAPEPVREGSMYASEDGLTLGYDWEDGRVSALRLGGVDLRAAQVPSGFLVRDVAADSGFHGFHKGTCSDLKLKLTAEFAGGRAHIRVSGTLLDTSGEDRAVTLLFALPVDALGWVWHDDLRRQRAIEPGLEYLNAVNVRTGATGLMSLYPWAAISNHTSGLAVGLDMSSPAQYRIGYNAGTRQFFIAYDFGLAPETRNFPHSAPFAFVIYRIDPEWGFRSAARKFYSIFPDHFLCRSKDQGIWMPFTDVSTVQGWQDFGFKYHEGNNNVPFDDEAGILSFRYTEPSTWWMRMPDTVPRTEEGVMKHLQASRSSGDRSLRGRAQALELSGSRDRQGRLQYLVRNTPWCDGAVFSLNPSPFIPGDSEARLYWNDEVKQRLYGKGAKGVQDGEYLDSLEAYVTATENFNRRHFHYVTVPLTFSSGSKQPVIHKIFSIYEFTRWLSEDLHRMGKLLFANSVPHRFSFLCAWLDVMGTETNWVRDGQWRPSTDADLSFKRTMCYQKPYLLLMNTRFDPFTPDLVEKYFQRSLFYGIFPSMFSHNASEDQYWRNPTWYNRDRHLFKRYIPIVKRVAEAGWEPLTHARSSNAKVYVERFGPDRAGNVYLTVLNDSAETEKATITVQLEPLGLKEVGDVRELVADEDPAFEQSAGTITFDVELAPDQVRVFLTGAGSTE